jgi:hypothetical protein
MSPSRRLGRLAQLLVVSQQALTLYRAEALSLSLLPSVHDAALALTPLPGVSLSSYSRWHRAGRQPRRCFFPPPPATPRVPSCAVFPLLISSLTQPVRAATHRRGERGRPTTLRSECLGGSWHGPPSCLMPLPSPPRSLAISIDHAVTLSSLFFPDHPHLATRSTTSSAVYQSMQVRGSAIQRAADAAMGVRRWESRRCRHSD